MKKNKILLLSIMMIISILLIMICIVLTKKEEIDINTNEKHVLIVQKYENYAWSYVSYGSFICTDGTIYTYDKSEKKNNNSNNTSADALIEIGKLSKKRVSNRDMKILLDNIKELERREIKLKNAGNDIGSYATIVYKENEPITIKQRGDFEGEDKTKEAQRIIKIANKYLN